MSTHTYEPTRPGGEPPRNGRQPLKGLVKTIGEEGSLLFRSTIALLRQELSENVQETRAALVGTIVSVGILGFGLLFALVGIDFLLIQLVSPRFMEPETAAWVCTLGLGVLFLIVGAIMFVRKSKKIQPERMIPSKTLEILEGHAYWAKDESEEFFK